MAIGSTNSSMNTKIQEDIEALQNPEFKQASTRSNINSKESNATILGKIKKYFTDIKSFCYNSLANNLTTASSGSYALDAYQGKVLDDKINGLLDRCFSEVVTSPDASRKIWAPTAIITIEYDNKNSFGVVYERNNTINIIWGWNNLNLGSSSSSSGVTITSIPAWSRLCVIDISGGGISVSLT